MPSTFNRALLLALLVVSAGAAARLHPALAQSTTTDRFTLPATDAGLRGSGPLRRHEWFQNVWRQRRSAWAKRGQQDQGAVVFLGDSITQGWEKTLAATFPGMKIANRGIDGDTSRGVLLRLADDVLALKPRAVVLLIGTNDIEEGATPETVASDIRLILADLKQHNPTMPVVLCQIFPSSTSMRRPAETIRAANALVLEAVKGDLQVIPLDTYRLFADAGGDAPKEEFPDLLHPNDAGYTRLASALRPIFATLGLLETTPDGFAVESGFESLFDGRTLTGWGYRPTTDADKESARKWQASDPKGAAAWPIVTEATDFKGLAASPDGRFRAINGRLVVTTPAEGRKIQQLYTTREFGEDFTLKLEFRATPNADSGVYVRGPQLQVRDYRLAGPFKNLTRYKPQDWNELVVSVTGGVARATCNGEPLDVELKVPASGPIGVEGDRGQMEYRRIRISRSTR